MYSEARGGGEYHNQKQFKQLIRSSKQWLNRLFIPLGESKFLNFVPLNLTIQV